MLFPLWVLTFMSVVMMIRGDPLAFMTGSALLITIGGCLGK